MVMDNRFLAFMLAADDVPVAMFLVIVLAVIGMGLVLFILSRYRRCPSNRVMVIYGKTGQGAAKCMHGGAAFVFPVFQAYDYLDIDAFNVSIREAGAVSRDNVRILVSLNVTAAISPEAGMVEKAAARLLGLDNPKILSIVEGILVAKMREVLAEVPIEELKRDCNTVRARIGRAASAKLAEIGVAVIALDVSGLDPKD